MATTIKDLRSKANLFLAREIASVSTQQDAESLAKLIAPRDLPLLATPWRLPDGAMDRLASLELTRAWIAVQRAVSAHHLVGVPTGFSSYPTARFAFSQGTVVSAVPLLASCLDDEIYEGFKRVLANAQGRPTRKVKREIPEVLSGTVLLDLYEGDDGRELMERANEFLGTEIRLWEIARVGRFDGPVPYPVRYWAARYLWSPAIRGLAFCIRCGETVTYKRRGRSGQQERKVPLCRDCLRSDLTWPMHAVMPHDKGQWWLQCQRRDCTNAFIGYRQARFCPEHRSAGLTASKRQPIRARRS